MTTPDISPEAVAERVDYLRCNGMRSSADTLEAVAADRDEAKRALAGANVVDDEAVVKWESNGFSHEVSSLPDGLSIETLQKAVSIVDSEEYDESYTDLCVALYKLFRDARR